MTNWKEVIETENFKAVQELIKSGADVNEPDENGFTPLLFAVAGQNRRIIKALIKAGADINTPCKSGETALMTASAKWNANPRIIKLLLKSGADINMRDAQGKTALMYASEGFFVDQKTIKILLNTCVRASRRRLLFRIVRLIKRLVRKVTETRRFRKFKSYFTRFSSWSANKLRKIPFLAKDNRFDRICAFYQKQRKAILYAFWILVIAIGFGIHSCAHSYTATKAMNCRDKAGTHGQIIGKIAKDERVSCSSFEGEWCKTVCNGKDGFVYNKYLK